MLIEKFEKNRDIHIWSDNNFFDFKNSLIKTRKLQLVSLRNPVIQRFQKNKFRKLNQFTDNKLTTGD